MGFNLFTAARHDLTPQVAAIAQSYFTIDTASSETAYGWYAKNPDTLIMAVTDGIVHGYADFLPLTADAQKLIENRELREENITADHILPPDAARRATAIYFAGIAIRDRKSTFGARCAAALLGGWGHMLATKYDRDALKYIYANPTTFSGNRLTRRMGLGPVSFNKKTTEGMDLYMLSLDGKTHTPVDALYPRYKDLIDFIEWA